MHRTRTCDPWVSPESLMETCWRRIWNRAPWHPQLWNIHTHSEEGGEKKSLYQTEVTAENQELNLICRLAAAWEWWASTGELQKCVKAHTNLCESDEPWVISTSWGSPWTSRSYSSVTSCKITSQIPPLSVISCEGLKEYTITCVGLMSLHKVILLQSNISHRVIVYL